MKKKLLLPLLFVTLFTHAQEYTYNYNFFTNSAMPVDYYFSSTDNGGGSFLYNRNFRLLVNESIFHSPGNSLQIGYINARGGHWKATIYRQEKRGMDNFKKSSFLSFWLYSSSPEPNVNDMPAVQLMMADSSLSAKQRILKVKGKEWQQVLMPLAGIKGVNINEPSKIIGIVFSQSQDSSSKRQTLYIDDIELLPEANSAAVVESPAIENATGYAMHVDLSWKPVKDKNIRVIKIYRSADGNNFEPVGVQQPYINRYADFIGETGKKYFYKISYLNNNFSETKLSPVAEAATRPMSDAELLTMVQEASFRYYWEAAESVSGLAKENIAGRQNMIATGASGFGIMALITGTERKFITRKEAANRFEKIVNFLEKAETFHGAYPHFINGPTGKVETFFGKRDNGADLVETSFLMQGLLAARQYFSKEDPQEKLIRDKITSIWKKVEWSWFKQKEDSKFLYWHWSPDQGWVINHTLIGWNETMVTYLLAIASPTSPVPASMYYSGWANQGDTGQRYRSGWGQTKEGSMYTNGNTYFGLKLDVGVSNGGPLFFTHYSYMGYDPHLITDAYTNYFRNNEKIAKINLRYCMQNPNHFTGYSDSAWGLTASDGPFDYSADEPIASRDHGKIAPTGAISSFPYTPAESMKALRNYYYNFGKFLWGEYGFKDAFDLTHNWCSEIYMGLNQAPMTVMIENYRTGLVWKLFMSDPDVKAGMEKLQQESNQMRNKRRQ